ncbi:MAG TPA: fused MFS/spermidine synthase [Patescibacteria group bacterium]|nr:fused MFS/spermidine synthase [Patescibacteria group bacterium]
MGENTHGVRENHWYLYVIVSLSGASVLAVEILGTRILGPFYGVSLFLWSALITVTLSALAVGYAVGGRLADRDASPTRLGLILAVAGAWLIFIPVLQRPVLWISEPLGLRPAVIIAAFILFFPPLTALGMVSPYAIKLRTATLGEVGRSAGNLYSVSTVAGVAAALLTGFILIPHAGISRLTVAVGAILLIAAAFSAAMEKRRSARTAALSAVFIACAAAAPFIRVTPAPAPENGSVIAEEQSPYAQIKVIDYRGARFLLIDGAIHTFTDISTGETLFPYVNVLDIARFTSGDPGEALLVGLGGGSAAKHFTGAGWHVDAVEIDPVVVRFAAEYFGLEPGDADIYTMDGRHFLRTTENRYDIIILDAFGSGSIPFHLVTREAFGLVSSRLRDGGVLAVNLQTIGWKSTIVRSLAATLKEHFTDVLALPIVEPPNKLGNVILLASNRSLDIDGELPTPESRFSAEYDRTHAWNNRFVPDTDGVPALTDDRNPVDLWTEEINLVERRKLNEYFKDFDVLW